MAEPGKRLYRSRNDRKVFGILGGIAKYFGLDPSLVRIAYVAFTIFTAFLPGILFYWLMFFIIPIEPKNSG